MGGESAKDNSRSEKPNIFLIILASSAGSAFEWYDFFLYGAVSTVLSKIFFAGVSSNLSYLFALLTFAAGFAVRPVGAAFFGQLGDIWGRKNTFLVTMFLMGASTFLVGCLPSVAQAGLWSPIALVLARLVQGFAVGGEYGGAVVYIAEHAPEGRRGLYTSFIQITCSFGLVLALSAVLVTRLWLGEASFAAWGWRIPFLLSAVLFLLSLIIRLRLSESPVFTALQRFSELSKRPLRDAFGNRANRRRIFLATCGLTAGMTVIFYNSQVYSQFFLERVMHVDGATANALIAGAIVLATPFFVFFGWLSDRYGRKYIIMAGCFLAAVTYFPLFHTMARYSNPALARAMVQAPVSVTAPKDECSWQFDITNRTSQKTACDIARSTLANAGVSYAFDAMEAPGKTIVQIGMSKIEAPYGVADKGAFKDQITQTLRQNKYPSAASPSEINIPMVLLCLFIMVFYVTMCYGPLAAILVELFPPEIRYTSLSISYNAAVGWLGGFVPAVAYTIVISTGNIFSGLWYPVVITVIGAIIMSAVDDDRTLTLK